MRKRKSYYLEGVEEGYYTYCDTRKMSKYKAANKLLDLLLLLSDQVYDSENDFYYRKMKNKVTISLNRISSFNADTFTLYVNSVEDEWDEDWSISMSFSEKSGNGQIQYNNLVFKGNLYDELSIDGLIYSRNLESSLGVEITLLTSVNL